MSHDHSLKLEEKNLESDDDYQYFDFDPFLKKRKKGIPKQPVKDAKAKLPDKKNPPKEIPKPPPPAKEYVLYWYNPPPYLTNRPDALNCGFQNCMYKNCKMVFEKQKGLNIDAVLFDGRKITENITFTRSRDQVWIFAAHEPPLSYMEQGGWWTKSKWRHSFNWTMTYDKTLADIYLPYGQILKKDKPLNRDFKAITMQKSKGAIMISSRCKTASYREDYMTLLRRHNDVVVLGQCGTPWNCGKQYVHDDCFKILNSTYRFYLAFENSFCRHYFTEKFYENFNYDIIQIVRGGKKEDARKLLPAGTFISTDNFKSVEELGTYLTKLSWSVEDYSAFLKEKNKYYSPGYKYVYQRAMCDLCERMNDLNKYKRAIPDIVKHFYWKNPCRDPDDLH